MRLDKLVIGSPRSGAAQQFKNLKNVAIDFDEKEWVTVVIGWNGTGKSNVLEALATIFRDLIAGEKVPPFSYQLSYRCHGRRIHIDADPDRAAERFIIHVDENGESSNGKEIQTNLNLDDSAERVPGALLKATAFFAKADLYLPRFVFGYYSGESPRLQAVFRPYLKKFDEKLRNPKSVDPGFRRLFYALPIHSQFVLLAFALQQDDVVRRFLDEHLGFDLKESIEYVLFVLREPPWNFNKGRNPRGAQKACKSNPDIFWGAEGVVRSFLDRLHRVSLAPVKVKRRQDTTLWNKTELEYQHLFVKDQDALIELVGNQKPRDFFRDLESTYVSELIEEVRIRVKLRKAGGGVTFRELSEGEQQLLTVLGLMRFTAEDESLFLLDEPDTHLNPKWSVDYLRHLEEVVGLDAGGKERSHVLLTTHNPLAIAELNKEQVAILKIEEADVPKIAASHPELDPRGQGYAAIVTSDMFGIASSLDRPTQELLEKQRLYAGKKSLSEQELYELGEINEKLDRLGFRFVLPDDEYTRYLGKRFEKLKKKLGDSDPTNLTSKVLSMTREEREALAAELMNDLMGNGSPEQ